MLQAIDEPLDLIEYNRWNVILPEGEFLTEVPSFKPACLSAWTHREGNAVERALPVKCCGVFNTTACTTRFLSPRTC